ncbi:MAG: precorrin-2 C(20)-methyltransferase, partial [Geminicoccaceae bacterium]|nr:precorrin-2 C(20)-methyltransferase [Geminicoccaceae bacterium]
TAAPLGEGAAFARALRPQREKPGERWSGMRRGKLIGLGVGPGDPELLTVKAVRILETTQVVAFVATAGRTSRARETVAAHLKPGTRELVAVLPTPSDPAATARAYAQLATGIVGELGQGQDVVFLCEGDPLFNPSFAQLLERLAQRFECVAVPGIPPFSAAAAGALWPLVLRDQTLAIVSGTLPPRRLAEILRTVDRVVVLRIGRNLPKIREALAAARMAREALLVDSPGQPGRRLEEAGEEPVGPLAIVLAARESPAPSERPARATPSVVR